MKRKIPVLASAILVAVALCVTAYATAGTVADYFVSLLHLEEIFVKPVRALALSRSDALAANISSGLDSAFASQAGYVYGLLNDEVYEMVYERVSQKVADASSLNIGTMQRVSLEKGDRVVGTPGAGFIMATGEAAIYGSSGSVVLNITAGVERTPGAALDLRAYYMIVAHDGSGAVVTSEKSEFFIRQGASIIKNYTPVYESEADILKNMGLFLGTANGYELNRPPTRQEALIMLIRLLGEEQSAKAFTGTTTFTDLTGWEEGKRYIAYGHDKGYTSGLSATVFGQSSFSTVEMYLTFVLRALGYSDSAGDFVWNTTSKDLAVQIGLLSLQDLDGIAKTGIMRDHVVHISLNALFAKLKGSDTTLGSKLVSLGVISEQALAAARP